MDDSDEALALYRIMLPLSQMLTMAPDLLAERKALPYDLAHFVVMRGWTLRHLPHHDIPQHVRDEFSKLQKAYFVDHDYLEFG